MSEQQYNDGQPLRATDMNPSELRAYTASFRKHPISLFLIMAASNRDVAETQYNAAIEAASPEAEGWLDTMHAIGRAISYIQDVQIALELGLDPPDQAAA